jgi:hypothetical protein
MARFDPNVRNSDGTYGSWRNYSRKLASTDAVATYSPLHDILVVAAFRSEGAVYAIDLKNPDREAVRLADTGNIPLKRKAAGWEWSATRKSVIYWRSGIEVYELRSSSADWANSNWTWGLISAQTSDLAPTGTDSDNGIYSRFRIVRYSDAEVAVVVNGVSQDVFAFRIPELDRVSTPSPPTDVVVQ